MELNSIKTQFPIFNNYSKNNFLYLDSASTTLKHESVISKLNQYNSEYSANIHRSVYPIAEKATNEFEKSRVKVANFINSKSEEIIFTKNTTESINLVAYSWGLSNLKKDDIILISKMEHHSNIIPWQFVAKKTGCQLKYIPLLEDGNLDIDSFESLLSEKVKLVSLIHQSNVTGSINPIQEIVKKAHSNNALVLIDAAQSISHIQIDINKIDCDFLVFSGHKMFGSTGVGILYGKYELLDRMDPFLYGGQMINKVNEQNSTWNVLPLKFEAGTPNIAEVISLGASIDFIKSIGFNKINEHLSSITNAYLEILNKCRGITIYGHRKNRGPVISFNIENIHAYDFCQIMGQHNISLRAGNHCAQPLLEQFGTNSASRISFQIYNNLDELDYFEEKLKQTIDLLI
ncbi:MAG: cysteine desulfurase [Candidatus Marinimicrobia bacterium]|nr:cysteine desulfurase [Candidatus Neomarinimicrobiota bacterium]|tara:strand:+ start:5471 stop:6679 length:1209 start_codon:yes stop_codon:yes gene_type:complete